MKIKMVPQRKPWFSSERIEQPCETSNQNKSDGLVHCSVKMLLFCAKTIMKESCKFELACLKKKRKKKEEEEEEEEEEEKKKKEKHFGRLATFWCGTFTMLFSATGCVIRHKNTRR